MGHPTTDGSQPVITTQGLSRKFGETTAVHDLELRVFKGEVFGMLGHNGAGKTTTVRMLNGVLNPSAGSARVLGYDPVKDGPALRQRTGVSTETPSFDERLTAQAGLEIFADIYGVPSAQVSTRVQELLELFELSHAATQKVGAFSKGMKQRLTLARTLLHDPELLFLDEPSSGLDPVAARGVDDLIRRLSQEGKTVFLCTHNLAQAQSLCDRVAVLEHGKVVALGTPADLARQFGYGQALELELAPESIPTALTVLKQRGLEATRDGDTLSVTVKSRDDVPDLIAGLTGAGARLYRVNPQELPLEAVYFALHQNQALHKPQQNQQHKKLEEITS